MKFEHGIIPFFGFLILVILVLILSNPNEIPSITQLNQINEKALLAKEDSNNQDKIESYKSMMKEKLEPIAANSLGINNVKIFLENYFPFRAAADIEIFDKEGENIPICDIVPGIPVHLKRIRNSDMYSMFIEKYQNYPIELFIQDERRYRSTVHYSLVAKSNGNDYTASAWFHIDSCTSKMSVPYNLSCRNIQTNELMHTRDRDEIVLSLEDNKFCEINLKPWRQELYDYGQTILDRLKEHQQKLKVIEDDPTFEKVMAFQYEMSRLGLLGNIAGHAMDGNFNDKRMQDMKKEYRDRFSEIPDDLLALIEK